METFVILGTTGAVKHVSTHALKIIINVHCHFVGIAIGHCFHHSIPDSVRIRARLREVHLIASSFEQCLVAITIIVVVAGHQIVIVIACAESFQFIQCLVDPSSAGGRSTGRGGTMRDLSRTKYLGRTRLFLVVALRLRGRRKRPAQTRRSLVLHRGAIRLVLFVILNRRQRSAGSPRLAVHFAARSGNVAIQSSSRFLIILVIQQHGFPVFIGLIREFVHAI
mmetsp:Transcript_41442/g.66665  ORF Transcript_41442/g.66665 Transcript_41442/m.66665 type:complete len:223 (-) Transcript_41442:521-1189(-)